MNHDVRPDVDDIDRQLIGHLVEDGRATFAALAPLVGLSQAAVRTRVQRLLDDDVIAALDDDISAADDDDDDAAASCARCAAAAFIRAAADIPLVLIV